MAKPMLKTLIICLSVTAGFSLAQAQTTMPMHSGTTPHMMTPAADTPSTTEFKAADAKMMQGMSAPYTGDADVDFRTHMIPHHQGAIDMAKVALKYAKDPETKKMAQTIIDAQEKEIADMQAWLKAHAK
ncbi:DUF305 domain-containing protein [Azorhizobium sp. AG788]|uniref:CopM family metallochaperone n=1 Tax=Azorhizobium sp. AG788 TaxID=2183897 RepID=UPI0031393690